MKFFSTVVLFAAAAFAAPVDLAEVETREVEARANPTTCGNNYYSASQVQKAVNAACNTQAGNYPHVSTSSLCTTSLTAFLAIQRL